jgi:hypothetical protein
MARMARKLSDVAVVQAIAAEVKRSTRSMLAQLLQACGKRIPPWVHEPMRAAAALKLVD